MIEIGYRIAGGPVAVHVCESARDLPAFDRWARDRPGVRLAVDTETTGLDIYRRDHRLRLIQIGDERDAWVFPVAEAGGVAAVHPVLSDPARPLVAHNATYDLLVLDRHASLPLESTYPRTLDTGILSRLYDPRGKEAGGTGHRLKDLSAVWIDAAAPDTEKDLEAEFHRLGFTSDTGYALIPTWNRTYLLYAGLDVILTARLLPVLGQLVADRGLCRLQDFDHAVAGICARLERRGMRIDVGYTRELGRKLERRAEVGTVDAARWGVSNVNSTRQVATALSALGVELHERTATGAPRVDKAVLTSLADPDRIGGPIPLAAAVMEAKRAGKWLMTYAEAMLQLRDDADRVHPKIKTLEARTARMSVSRPPLQQLPSSDWTVRRCFIADPGHVIVAADYAAVEMRILAALAGVDKMLAAIARGDDIHDFTARLIVGEKFTRADRKIFKAVGFGKVYGGGLATLARQTGAAPSAVAVAVRAYDREFPQIKRYGRRLQRDAGHGVREVVTPSGRHLPLDRDRLYAATNYVVQSTARDVLASALLDLDEAGLTDHLLLPVHDEVIAQAPAAEAADLAAELSRVMTYPDFYGVPLAVEASVYGTSWGHGYGAPAEESVNV